MVIKVDTINAKKVETIRLARSESICFAYMPVQGHYRVLACIPRSSCAMHKYWTARLLNRIRFKHSFDEMKSRILFVS